MRFCIVGNLVAHTGLQGECPPVFELGVKLTFDAQKNVSLDAPVISAIARRVVNHPDADVSKLLCSPVRATSLAAMLRRRQLRPVCRSEWDARHLHSDSWAQSPPQWKAHAPGSWQTTSMLCPSGPMTKAA